jgi:ubiquinone/menaquinone biosynthesis C-methylase UbiE
VADLKKFRALALNWEALGDDDPFYGVLSDPSKHGNQWSVDEFFASGRAHVQTLLRRLADARATFTPGRCLDFGCGVGRLTLPLSELFEHTVGIDVAEPMIAAARRHRPPGARCEFVVNHDPHLRRFADGTFDVVHSSLVLQHIPPPIAMAYVEEFFRVCRSGGLVVFQLPAEARTPEETLTSYALPESAFTADIELVAPAGGPLATAAFRTILVRVTNRGNVAWPHDIPAGRHICVGNHWLREDGSRVIDDDARAFLPHAVKPGMTVEIPLTVQAPDQPGQYVLEIDLVQEHVSWFNARGSRTARERIMVVGEPRGQAFPALAVPASSPPSLSAASGAPSSKRPLVRRLLRRLRGATPTFEMHVVARVEVEQAIQRCGGRVVRAVDDNAAGPGWLSYTYICRKC